MIRWLKNFFKIRPGEGAVPIRPSDVKLREYVYMGDGMMEEVIRQPEKAGNVGSHASSLNADELKARLEKLKDERAQRQNYIDTTPIVVAAAVSSWTGDSSYSDSGSCDSSSSSCD
ncbi:Mrh.1 hypothetical protein [Escherichia phage JS98]|uniref:Uncharacterized protein mrh.1 n=1 Tax=Escherichia phage JS98 TaxID=293178 RepID=A8R8X4_9CAUD|nr:Mrh.1 hypothetical protein [Escherichia phage JS98]ABX11048.1 Mrh.1 hypothetical protein [Escherichia phage JS98]